MYLTAPGGQAGDRGNHDLAQTGAAAGLTGLAGAGLLLLLAGLGLSLRRRRS